MPLLQLGVPARAGGDRADASKAKGALSSARPSPGAYQNAELCSK